MTINPRYAIYFVPDADSALYRYGATTLGYDCLSGRDIASFDAPPVDADEWRELTNEPRRYGFHATLKAPFRLREGCEEAELIAAFRGFARKLGAAPTIAPVVRLLQRFVAIVPASASAELDDLASACVTDFDRFRAPLAESDRARRLAADLTARQIENVGRWGYPYVFADFRFHMTLSGALAGERREMVLSFLRGRFRQACGEHPVAIDRLALLRQDRSDARFIVMCQLPFGGVR